MNGLCLYKREGGLEVVFDALVNGMDFTRYLGSGFYSQTSIMSERFRGGGVWHR